MNKHVQLEKRLHRLERHNRLLLALCVTISGLVVLSCAALNASPGFIRTSQLQIVDADGRVMLELGETPDGYGLAVNDQAGRTRVALGHDSEGSALYIKDEAGDSRVGIAHFAHGGSGVALHGPNVRGAAVLYYKNTGSLTFYDTDGAVQSRTPQ